MKKEIKLEPKEIHHILHLIENNECDGICDKPEWLHWKTSRVLKEKLNQLLRTNGR